MRDKKWSNEWPLRAGPHDFAKVIDNEISKRTLYFLLLNRHS
jgi:hypothetical protein